MTTILAVRRPGDGVTRHFAMGGDGQVSMGPTMAKGDARKVRRLGGGRVLAGFAGATADAFTLLDRLEGKLEASGGQLVRAAVDLARDWRTDRYLRRLEALMVVADRDTTLMLSGQGDVIEPETTDAGTVIGIGSGGNYAAAAARALLGATTLDAAEIVRQSILIAAGIDVYTNDRLTIETFDA